jgi:hypothetical protein
MSIAPCVGHAASVIGHVSTSTYRRLFRAPSLICDFTDGELVRATRRRRSWPCTLIPVSYELRRPPRIGHETWTAIESYRQRFERACLSVDRPLPRRQACRPGSAGAVAGPARNGHARGAGAADLSRPATPLPLRAGGRAQYRSCLPQSVRSCPALDLNRGSILVGAVRRGPARRFTARQPDLHVIAVVPRYPDKQGAARWPAWSDANKPSSSAGPREPSASRSTTSRTP